MPFLSFGTAVNPDQMRAGSVAPFKEIHLLPPSHKASDPASQKAVEHSGLQAPGLRNVADPVFYDLAKPATDPGRGGPKAPAGLPRGVGSPQSSGAAVHHLDRDRVPAARPLAEPQHGHLGGEAQGVPVGAPVGQLPLADAPQLLPGQPRAVLLAHVRQAAEGEQARAHQGLVPGVLLQDGRQRRYGPILNQLVLQQVWDGCWETQRVMLNW